MTNNPPSINLVKNRQAPLLDKFMDWALTIGRLIVILTEVVAVIAFVYRFSLDEKLVNLHDQIKQQQNIISALKSDETKYRNLQDRLALAVNLSEKNIKSHQAIADIATPVSGQVKINDLILNKDRENIHIDVTSVSALADFVDSLKKNPGLKSISIDNIESKPSIGLSVDITAMLN